MAENSSLIVANWKMNCTEAEAIALAGTVASALKAKKIKNEVVISPPFTYISSIRPSIVPAIKLGAQTCSSEKNGAYTGEISACMLKSLGCEYVILGHSERRKNQCETSPIIARKADAAIKAGLKPIICVGESLDERKFGREEHIVSDQLEKSIPASANAKNSIIAYEPVWAIGTGENASDKQIAEMHAFITSKQPGFKVLYGGSVKADNAEKILKIKNVGGLLIGGASLNAQDFVKICA